MTTPPKFRQRLFLTLTAVVFASLVLQTWLMFRVGEVMLGISDPVGFLVSRLVPLLWQSLPIILVAGALLMRKLEFLDAVTNRLHRKEPVAPEELSRAKKDLLAIPLWVYSINLVGYTVGLVVQMLVYPQRLFSWSGGLEILFNFASAGLIASLILGLFNLILGRVRELLHVTRLDPSLGKPQKQHTATFWMAFFLSAYVILFGLMVGARYADTQTEYIHALQRVMSGEDRAAVSKQYYDNLRQTYSEAGIATRDDLLAIAPALYTAGSFFLPVALLFLALASGGWWISTRYQALQLVKLRDRMEEALEGGNLERELEIVQLDEVGQLAHAINLLTHSQNQRLHQLTRAAVSVEQATRPLPEITRQSQEAALQIQVSSSSIVSVADREIVSVHEAQSRLDAALTSFDDIVVGVDAQSAHVSSASSAMKQMASSIAGVTKTTQEAKSLAERLKVNSQSGTKALASAVLAIQAIETASREVDKLTSSIAKISSQTSLLAMNAAIEAAHAGDTGSGFAVVAEEVRELATSSSASNTKIKKKIAEMLVLVENGVHQSTEVGQSFDKIGKDIASTAALVSEIASAMQEQNVGTEQILVSMAALVEASNLIRETAGVQKEHNVHLRQAVGHITGSFETIRGGGVTVAQDSRKIQEAVSRLEAFTEDSNVVVDKLAAVVKAMGGKTESDRT
ncbi:MAG: methyl-accepting chemotaxis protein [Spirochaetales bacterium]